MSRDELYKGRVSLKYHYYHITICTQNKTPFFNQLTTAQCLITQMKKLVSEQQILSVAWVIMPDHLHWLFQLTSNNSLSKVIQTLKGRSSRVINQQNDKIQFSWQRGFHDHGIRTEENLIQVARYIVANPLRAGLVERVGDYPLWDTVYL